MTKYTQLPLKDATPPVQAIHGPKLVYKNTRLPQYPAYVLLQKVHATYPNDVPVNYVKMIRNNMRMLTSHFDKLLADGTFVPTDTTARITGKLRPSTRSEMVYSEAA